MRLRLKLVRTSDSSVIWRGDSISARSLATVGCDGLVSIPVQQAAGANDTVFVRMAVDVPTAMDDDLAGCFAFGEDTTGINESGPGPIDARGQYLQRRESKGTEGASSAQGVPPGAQEARKQHAPTPSFIGNGQQSIPLPTSPPPTRPR